MFLLLGCWILTGIMAEDPEVTHYQLKNSSVCLHVSKPPPRNSAKWTFAGTFIISSDTSNPNFANKVDYERENLTLCLKQLTDTDSGIYKVSFHDSGFKEVSETHRVIVEEHVPRPVIRISVLFSNLSAGLCSISVNCSVHDDWVRSVCDEDDCRTSDKSLTKVNISVSTYNRTVVCSGNNHVSTNNVSESMTTMCSSKSAPEHTEALHLPIVIVICVAVLVVLISFFTHMVKTLFLECNHHQGQTSAAHLGQSHPVEAQPQHEPRASTSSSSQAEATYENLDATQSSSATQQSGSTPSEGVDTVYCMLQAPNVIPSLSKSDKSRGTKGREMIREPPTSQPVSVNEAECLTKIDTVYSVLQKPKKQSQLHQQAKQDLQKR
ncbi:uncharacterized protein LOC121176708 [Toxotes jaculatrix]|uniref:uncharacterized protein LOC121176708 n=1 Tax=Toxotes jaculatrix TaxID=941984 RepID=UPI001B3ACA5D|nr:uncharacterized protein LOC121176708 [Toxotes jaculatrix]